MVGQKPLQQTEVSPTVQVQQPSVQPAQQHAGKRKGARVEGGRTSQIPALADEVRWLDVALVVDPDRELSLLTSDPEFQEAVARTSNELANDAVTSARASLAEVERVYDQLDAKIDHNIALARRENKILDTRLMEIRRLKTRFDLR